MSQIFHRGAIFNNPNQAWERYKRDAKYFVFPERVTIEITNRCNLQCFMCPRNKVKMEIGDMEVSLFKKIIDEIANFLPVCLVPFFRGEPLLHPRFLEMLSYAKQLGLKPIQIATNAYFLNQDISEKIFDSGIDFISFSIDTNMPEIYRKIRQNSDYEKVKSNIIYFLELKRKKGLTLPEIQISAVKTEKNASFLDEFIEFWSDKADRVRIYYAHSLENKLGQLENDEAQKKRKPCFKVLSDFVIYWNGDVAICNHDWQRDKFIGNVRDTAIQKIWNSHVYNEIRKRHLDNNLKDFSPCNYCSHWQAGYPGKHIIGELYERNKVSSG